MGGRRQEEEGAGGRRQEGEGRGRGGRGRSVRGKRIVIPHIKMCELI